MTARVAGSRVAAARARPRRRPSSRCSTRPRPAIATAALAALEAGGDVQARGAGRHDGADVGGL